jgi:hypothetical protein
MGESTDDRTTVVDLFARMLWAVDARDWEMKRECFADEVDADYSSIGGVDSVVPADDLLAGWEENLGALDATHHLLGSRRSTSTSKPAVRPDGRRSRHSTS